MSTVTWEQLTNNPRDLRPHVVLLGAGASVAAFPNADATNRRLPTMDNLIQIVGLAPVLQELGVESIEENFETVYSEVHAREPDSDKLLSLEQRVHDYFSALRLPETATLYDHLLLSLRPKDMVATFNWDPFLFDAYTRNAHRVPLPEILFLHGNVRVARCLEHRVQGQVGMMCSVCNDVLTPSRLLYPVTVKNYSADPFIAQQWKQLRWGLKHAFALTIFGYGAPSTDAEAVDLMKQAWSGDRERMFEMTEIIDIKDNHTVREQWAQFYSSSHLMHEEDYYNSWIPTHCRRSCEALYFPTVEGRPVERTSIPRDKGLDALVGWLKPLLEAEERASQ